MIAISTSKMSAKPHRVFMNFPSRSSDLNAAAYHDRENRITIDVVIVTGDGLILNLLEEAF
jgi:hypothetical protein